MLFQIVAYLNIKYILLIHHGNGNMQHIVKPLEQGKASCFLCKGRIIFQNQLLHSVRIIHNIRKDPWKLIPVSGPCIAAIAVKNMIILLRQYHNSRNFRKQLCQQSEILIELSFRKVMIL